MDKIINYTIKESSIPFHRPWVLKLKKITKMNKLIIKLLIRLKILEYYIEHEIKYTRVQIDKPRIYELIRHLYDEIYYNTDKQPRTIILGYDQMRKLEIEIYDEMRFNMPLELSGPKGRKILGMEIIINPRIDGVVLI